MRGYPYHILGTSERDDSLSYMIDCLLRSRIETGEETSDDEDVNVYLSALLHSFLDRTFYVKYGEFLSFYNIDVFQWAEGSADLRTKYQVYKGNADFALVTTGIFEEPISRASTWDEAECEVGSAVERGKLYYRFANAHITRLSRKRTAVAEVLEKLSDRFETYLKILSHMRGAYLNLMRRLSTGELFHLEREAQQGARSGLIQEGRDSFLDAYADWLNSGSDEDRQKVNSRADELSEFDPTFQFDGV